MYNILLAWHSGKTKTLRICVDQINIIIYDEYGNRKSIQYFIGDYSYWYDAFNYKDTTTLK